MRNYDTIFSAWDDDELVGIICVMDDGIMNAYIQYLAVRPDYQLKGIGKELITRVKNYYSDYSYISIVARNSQLKFYEYCGFEKSDNESPMIKTDLNR